MNVITGVVKYYKYWKKKRKQFGENSEFEAFMAGYTLGNNVILRERLIRRIRVDDMIEKDTTSKRENVDNFNY